MLKNDEENSKYLETIHKSASMGADLASQLMAIGSGQKFNPQLTDINKLIKETIKLMHNQNIFNRIKVKDDLTKNPLPVKIDKLQIMHSLMNICHNAKDAMPNGGVLTFSSKKLSLTDDFCLQNIGTKDGQYIHIKRYIYNHIYP